MKVAEAPSRTKTKVNPAMNRRVWKIVCFRTSWVGCSAWISEKESPVMYVMKEGMSGNTHGERNENNPAMNAPKKLTLDVSMKTSAA